MLNKLLVYNSMSSIKKINEIVNIQTLQCIMHRLEGDIKSYKYLFIDNRNSINIRSRTPSNAIHQMYSIVDNVTFLDNYISENLFF